MDNLDLRILKCLGRNARLAASAISEEVNLSVSAVIERIRKMEACGLIKGYTIQIDQEKIGNHIVAIVEISLRHPDYYDGFAEMVRNCNNIACCYYQTGEFEFALRIEAADNDQLDQVYRMVKSYEGVVKIQTHIVLKPVKVETVVLPEDVEDSRDNKC